MDEAVTHVDWARPRRQDVPFSVPFALSAEKGKLWIAPVDELHDGEIGVRDEDADDSPWSELVLKGTNWAGFQSQTACPHVMWRDGDEGLTGRNMSEHVAFLQKNGFNAVRLPLNAWIVTWHLHPKNTAGPGGISTFGGDGQPYNTTFRCGDETGRPSMEILDELILKLRDAGIFVMLDMHAIYSPVVAGEENYSPSVRDVAYTAMISDAWAVLAQRYCASPNVIMADIFNEPYAMDWMQWKAWIEIIGGRVQRICARWLIAVQGAKDTNQYCWGEDISGQRTAPIQLPVGNRLVMAPHTYGHFNFGCECHNPACLRSNPLSLASTRSLHGEGY